jgi:chemotaxis signal transduction protein
MNQGAAAPAADASGPDRVDVAKPVVELQGFSIGDHRFLINYIDAVELEEVPALAHLPAAPAWVAGLANLHGNVLPVLDWRPLLHDALSTAPPGGGDAMMLVVRHHRERVAILIDGVTRRMRFTDQPVGQAHGLTAFYGMYITRTFRVDSQDWHELDFASLLDELNTVQTQSGKGNE